MRDRPWGVLPSGTLRHTGVTGRTWEDNLLCSVDDARARSERRPSGEHAPDEAPHGAVYETVNNEAQTTVQAGAARHLLAKNRVRDLAGRNRGDNLPGLQETTTEAARKPGSLFLI